MSHKKPSTIKLYFLKLVQKNYLSIKLKPRDELKSSGSLAIQPSSKSSERLHKLYISACILYAAKRATRAAAPTRSELIAGLGWLKGNLHLLVMRRSANMYPADITRRRGLPTPPLLIHRNIIILQKTQSCRMRINP